MVAAMGHLVVSLYHYEIEFRLTKAHANTDGLSWLLVKVVTCEGYPSEVEAYNLSQLASFHVTASQLKTATVTDPELSRVLQFVQKGWPRIC